MEFDAHVQVKALTELKEQCERNHHWDDVENQLLRKEVIKQLFKLIKRSDTPTPKELL